ncbi:hypothetical protein C8Q80DRAFT_1224263 [Daedaleopsis nitida]|nr:hypothetical protein C8Q80DRAFT_1224263 [Daedaleopsis nitida]
MLWCAYPPLLRRLSPRQSYSDLTLAKKANLSRGDSKQSEKTLVDFSPRKGLGKHPKQHDIIVIDAPLPPPKDITPPSSAPPSPTPLTIKLKSHDSPRDKPLPPPIVESDSGSELEDEDSEPVFPWYRRRLLASDSTSRPTTTQPSLLPRCDFSLSNAGSSSAALSLIGGLVDERAQNDVYTVSVQDLSFARLYTTGDVPPPRFGHASASAGSVVVVWGGDTISASSNQIRARAKYDNGLYFLNLASREWTRISVDGLAPSGRIGHSVVMVGPRIYIFGGEADGELFNDLWCFDLSTLVSKPAWEQLELPTKSSSSKPSPKPARRTGHTCVAYRNELIVFGGTDGRYHYNDTWAFDFSSKTWSELSCTGYIPCQREGHAAALVDDIMYVFGGRGVDGGNIGELGAFKITTRRWFMFQKMGPEPSPRSGHGMAAVGSKVYVLGGVSEDDLKRTKNANVVHVLETNNIKFPTTKFSPPREKKLLR